MVLFLHATDLSVYTGEATVRHVGPKAGIHGSGIVINLEHFKPDSHPDDLLKPVIRYSLNDLTLKINLYGGSDLSQYPVKIKSYSTEGYRQGYGKTDPETPGGKYRDHSVAVCLELSKISFVHQIFEHPFHFMTTTMFSIRDFVVRDRVHASNIKDMLYQYSTPSMPRRTSAPMLAVRIAKTEKNEGKMRISLLPVKINIDQHALEFVTDFVEEIGALVKLPGKGSSSDVAKFLQTSRSRTVSEDYEFVQDPDGNWANRPSPRRVRTPNVDDLLSNSTMSETIHPSLAKNLISPEECEEHENFLDSSGTTEGDQEGKRNMEASQTDFPAPEPTFYREFVFSPPISIYVDYHGKRKVNMDKSGPLVAFLMAFGQLNKMPIELKELVNRDGMLGARRCIEYAINEWSADLMKNMPKAFASCGPISPLVQIGKGIADLFLMPMEEMRKENGRVVKGIQRGVGSFGVSSAVGIVGVAQTVAGLVQTVAEMTMPGRAHSNRRNRRISTNQAVIPSDFRHSLQLAYTTFFEGYRQTRNDLENPENGASGLSVIRYAVPTFLGPIVLASQVTYQLLGGLRSQLRPDIYQDERRKWGEEDASEGPQN
ncbi:unnamed protein product [Caenorhabditis auriculariae]|uniref:Autophagy-related protein 2 n=1 Tax=Caenorhabditis auriculariae TaxID=2777116 RepID=A0A8S1HIP3_9PELO|nr:unnamed protein product [Caenorhabditis auriculariae]